MDQRDNQRTDAPSEPNDRLEQQQFQQQKGRQDDTLSLGQSSASDTGLDTGDTTTQADRGSRDSTSAQRSGGQAPGGQGMGNESFEGSSLGGQASSDDSSRAMFNGERAIDRDPAKPSDLDGE